MQYIGARYIPKFMTPSTYDPTTVYENMCVVDNGMGTSYISKKPVPAGTPLTDTDYWAIYGASNGAIINLQNQIDAINTTIALLNNVYVTPQEFGAVGDGITDDTTAIQNAIDAAYNGTLVIPFGTYKITAPLVIEKAINIIGTQGAARTYRKSNQSFVNPTSFIIADDVMSEMIAIKSDYVNIKDIALKGNSKAAVGVKTENYYWTRINLENVHVEECTDKGFELYIYMSAMKLCTAYNCANYGFYLGGSAGMTSFTAESCFADDCNTGWYIRHFEYSTFNALAADNTSKAYVLSGCNTVSLNNCGCEVVDDPVTLDGSYGVTINGLAVEGMNLTNGVNNSGCVISCSTSCSALKIGGVYLTQANEYKGYIISAASQILTGIFLLDDTVRYTDISVDTTKYPKKSCVYFPNLRSVINDLMTLNDQTQTHTSCDKVHDGTYIVDVLSADASYPIELYEVCTLSLEPGTYIVKGTKTGSPTTNYNINVATAGYGSGSIANDYGETGTFTLNSTTTVYVSIFMKPNALRSVKFRPEIIKVA